MPTPTSTHGLAWSPLTRPDLPELADLMAAIEYLDDTIHRHELPELEAAFDRSDSDPEHNAVLLRQGGENAVAYAWNRCPVLDDPRRRVYLLGGCHPGWRHRGLGPTLLQWQIDRAREWYAETYRPGFSDLEMMALAGPRNPGQLAMLQGAGFVAQRWFHDLLIDLDGSAPSFEAPAVPGVRLMPCDGLLSEQVRLVHNQCYADRPGARQVDRASWEASLAAPGVRRDLSWVALAGDEVVGYAINSLPDPGEPTLGWTERLGALPRWRNQGLLSWLLAASLESFRTAGLTGAGIGVDTDSSSGIRPYLALGYEVTETLVWYVRREAPDRVGPANSP